MKPYYADESVTLYHGDCLEVLPTLADASVDAVVCDPPYGLEFMGKEWDAPWEQDSHVGARWQTGMAKVEMSDGAARLPRPSFEKRSNVRCRRCDKWRLSSNPCTCERPDFPNIAAANMCAFQAWCQLWATECLRVLKPGGHMLAFGGTRTWHRLACAIEDAGFEVRDSIAWIHGQGFPKSLNLGDGLGTALKPAFEPVVVARKPLVGSVAANVLAHGTGALNIDGCRATPGDGKGRDGEATRAKTYQGIGGDQKFTMKPGVRGGSALGRWPANVVLDESQADALDQMSGTLTSGSGIKVPTGKHHGFMDARSSLRNDGGKAYDGDTGGASRFFYVAKADSAERPRANGIAHPTVKPLALMRWLVRLVTPPGGLVLDPFAGSGTTLDAARMEGFRAIGVEREPDYLPLILQRLQQGVLDFEGAS